MAGKDNHQHLFFQEPINKRKSIQKTKMTPGAHLLISWLSSVEVLKERRERALVALSGVAPDLDGLGIIPDKLIGTTNYYFEFHHYLGHSIISTFLIAGIASFFAKSQKLAVWLLAFILVHVHIFCDVIGSKGPDGYHWPVYYLYPFDSKFELTWKYQWELNAWQNQVIMIILLLMCLYYAYSKKITFLEVFSQSLDKEAFKMYKKYVKKQTTS